MIKYHCEIKRISRHNKIIFVYNKYTNFLSNCLINHNKSNKMQVVIQVSTDKHNGLFDITSKIDDIVKKSKIETGVVNLYVQGATAGIMIQENWDDSVQNDVVNLLRKLIPSGIWQHDAQDNNGDSHLKAGIVGPSETIPIIKGKMGLSTWQNIFLCEFDGPRNSRSIIVTVFSVNS